jgi:hypothetical protein
VSTDDLTDTVRADRIERYSAPHRAILKHLDEYDRQVQAGDATNAIRRVVELHSVGYPGGRVIATCIACRVCVNGLIPCDTIAGIGQCLELDEEWCR